MTLPIGGNVDWPPAWIRPFYDEIALDSAWYSGDPAQISFVYGDPEATTRPHVPLPADLAATSADLLFSEPPDFVADTDAQVESIDDLLLTIGFHDSLLEAAEVASALGGVFLVPRWDKGFSDRPYIHAVHPDAAIPVFRGGKLASVVFWSVLNPDESTRRVLRHLESHDLDADGQPVITHGVYEGGINKLGDRKALSTHEATAELEETITIPIDGGLDCVYVPNLRPNRLHRSSPIGRSDFQGIEDLFVGLDKAFSSWVRDIDLGQSIVVVPEDWLERRRGQAAAFSFNQRIFAALPVDPTVRDKVGITHIQPQIRTDAHSVAMLNFIERAVTTLYSPQTFGLHIEGRADSGTALKIRERRTFLTQAKKQRLWGPNVERIVEVLLTIDKRILNNSDTAEVRPTIEWSEQTGEDISALAGTIETLVRAQAISIDERVRRLNPEWSEDDLAQEIEAIKQETAVTVPAPEDFGAPPAGEEQLDA